MGNSKQTSKVSAAKAKASKLARDGKYEQAIKLYEKIIAALNKRNRPDYSLYNTIGDIYANNLKNKELAIENYRTAMQFYADNSLFPNAIAMAKKIVKIDPNQIDMYEKIGSFNKTQGLIGEAINNYILYSEKSLKNNDTSGAIRAFKEVLQMMPEKVEFKERLVDLYIKEDQIEQAIELLKETESYYIKMNAMDQASAIRNKIKQLSAKLPKQPEPEPQPQPEPVRQEPQIEETIEDIDVGNLLGDLGKDLDETFSNIEQETNNDLTNTLNTMDNIQQMETPVVDNDQLNPEQQTLQDESPVGLNYETFVELGDLQKEMNPQEAIQSYYQGAEGYFSVNDLENALRVYNLILKVKPNEIKALKAIVEIGKKLNKIDYIVNADIRLAEIFSSTMPQDALQTINEALQYAPDNMQAMQVKMKILNILNPQQSQQTPVQEQKIEPIIQEPVQPSPQPKPQPEVINPVPEEPQKQINSELDFLNEFKSEITKDVENLDFLNDTKEQVTAQDILSGKNEGGKPKFKVEESKQSGDGDVWSLSELLDELKEGLDENIDEGDVSSHYELGMSFKEMGLFDMAIAEFEKSMKSKQYEMQSLEMLGQCYLEMNQLDLAENTLIKAMSISGKKPEEYLGIKFSLALLYEKKKMYKEALKLLKEIQAIKPDFENIDKHIKLISDTIVGEKPEPLKKAEKTEDFIDFAELINEEEFNLDDLDNIDDIDLDFDEEDENLGKDKNKKNISYM